MSTKFSNFSIWFNKVLFKAQIFDDRYPIKGFGVYKSWGAKIVRNITNILEDKLEATGHKPMLFPVVISEDAFRKEAEHIEGFGSEVFWVTYAGKRELKKRMVLRPTSETAMYPMFSRWIRSHADLPLKIYQSVPVYRYETKATRPLLRMREFLWNETHTAHQNQEDSEKQVGEAIEVYDDILKRLGISYYKLKRPDFDKFAGSQYSIAFDAWNPDGRVNQVGTVHNLGENFAKAFDVSYEDIGGFHKNVVQTCYGFGIARVIAAIISQHGDDKGLILPPEIAPVQVVIIPIPFKGYEDDVELYAKSILEKLQGAGIRAYLDVEDKTPGEKFYLWEMQGVPIRVEVGPRELENRRVTISERLDLKRVEIELDELISTLSNTFHSISEEMKERSLLVLRNMTTNAVDMGMLRDAIEKRRIARICWCEGKTCADEIKDESGGEIRGHRIDINEKPELPCIVCGKEAKKVVYLARAY